MKREVQGESRVVRESVGPGLVVVVASANCGLQGCGAKENATATPPTIP